VPYAFAGHFAMQHAKQAISHYKSHFEPSRRSQKPYAMCAVTVICGETDEDAQRLAAPVRVAIANTRTGKRAPIPTIEEALAHKFTEQEQAIVDDFLLGAVIGNPAHVRDRLNALAKDLDADEIMLSSLVPGHGARKAALARIAGAMS
jgi:alkanesulfonate monooxygenase SsuD/methylene tetrahydromethanopterin reductase-like flavin-dependent oxidoreductase (luciferase family)